MPALNAPDATPPVIRAASDRQSRDRLSRGKVAEAALAYADLHGSEALSMRKLGQQLGVDPMTVYRHVRDKDDLLAAISDLAVSRIAEVDWIPGEGWAATLRRQILDARATALQHPWLPRVLEARAEPTPATLAYLDRVLGILRAGGFSVDLTHHTLHVLGSRVLGFSQDLFDDSPGVRPTAAEAQAQAAAWASSHPHLAELALQATHEGALGGCDDDEEFAFSLDLILEGLERRRAAQPAPPA
jgi:AcrR family transcriptional regulator